MLVAAVLVLVGVVVAVVLANSDCKRAVVLENCRLAAPKSFEISSNTAIRGRKGSSLPTLSPTGQKYAREKQ